MSPRIPRHLIRSINETHRMKQCGMLELHKFVVRYADGSLLVRHAWHDPKAPEDVTEEAVTLQASASRLPRIASVERRVARRVSS